MAWALNSDQRTILDSLTRELQRFAPVITSIGAERGRTCQKIQ